MFSKKTVLFCTILIFVNASQLLAMNADKQWNEEIAASNDLNNAIDSGDMDQINRAFARGASIDGFKRSDSVTPLGRFVLAGKTNVVKWLLAQGANPNKKTYSSHCDAQYFNEIKNPLLHIQLKNKNCTEMAKLLIAHGADVNTADSSGITLLINAIYSEIFPLVKYLLETGKVNINQQNSFNRTALIYAARSGNCNITLLLLQDTHSINKVNINHQDWFGGTALMYAAMRGDRKMVSLLLKFGADKTLTNNAGKTAAQLAAEIDMLKNQENSVPELSN